jgi:hypothetical protein
MRRTAAALTAAILTASVLAGPSVAGASPVGDPVSQISCGTIGDPICPVIDQVTALLAPLEPVLALAGPALTELGQSANLLTALLESGPDLPPDEVVAATGAVLQAINELTAPLIDLLRGAGLQVAPLESALSELQQLATERLAPAAEPAPEAEPAPAPAADQQASTSPASRAPATSTSASTPTGFNAPVSSGGPSARGDSSSRAVPNVPVGGTLQLGPLALPRFGLTTAPAASAEELATEAVVENVVLPAVSAAVTPEAPDSSKATAVVVAISTLMLAAGLLIDQARKARLPIQL